MDSPFSRRKGGEAPSSFSTQGGGTYAPFPKPAGGRRLTHFPSKGGGGSEGRYLLAVARRTKASSPFSHAWVGVGTFHDSQARRRKVLSPFPRQQGESHLAHVPRQDGVKYIPSLPKQARGNVSRLPTQRGNKHLPPGASRPFLAFPSKEGRRLRFSFSHARRGTSLFSLSKSVINKKVIRHECWRGEESQETVCRATFNKHVIRHDRLRKMGPKRRLLMILIKNVIGNGH